MIELIYHSDCAFVYNPNDWETLRKEYRIIGEIFGKTKFIPTLPVKLTPEETIFLVKQNIAKLTEYNTLRDVDIPPNEQTKQKVKSLTTALLKEEKKVYLQVRKQELENTIDKIVTGKRKRGDNRSAKDILQSELKKSTSAVTKETMIWPIFTSHSSEFKDDGVCPMLSKILQRTTTLKCAVYKDLWNKGYYITAGEKFGGDFLVYLGDPIAYHAVHIVRCVEDPNGKISPSELIAFGRLGSSVKKNAVFASMVDDGAVSYITINWMDS